MLRPLNDLPLRQGERVNLIVLRQPDSSRWNLERLASEPSTDIDLAEESIEDWAERLDAEDRQ